MNIKPIRTKADHRAALKRVEELWDANPKTPEGDELDVLATLISAYEDEHFHIPSPEPIEAIKFRNLQNSQWFNPPGDKELRMVIIELKQYGDFGILQTDSVWYNAELTSFNPIDFPTDRTTNAARAYLRDHGFKEMKTKSCVVGGDL